MPQFETLLFDCVCPTVKSLLRNLQEDYLACTAKHGPVAASGQTTRVLSVARILLLEYSSHSSRMLGEVDLLVTLMLHSMQPYRGDTDATSSSDGHPASGMLLCCAVLCCAVLCCAVLCCAVLYCTVLSFHILHFMAAIYSLQFSFFLPLSFSLFLSPPLFSSLLQPPPTLEIRSWDLV